MKYFLIATLVVLSSCSKNTNNGNDGNGNGTACGPLSGPSGKGGNAVIQATVVHHAKGVYLGKVYIKYNTTNQPTCYDDSTIIVSQNGIAYAYFSNLTNGDYYLYGYGNDTIQGYNPVIGGLPYHISTQDTNRFTLYISEKL